MKGRMQPCRVKEGLDGVGVVCWLDMQGLMWRRMTVRPECAGVGRRPKAVGRCLQMSVPGGWVAPCAKADWYQPYCPQVRSGQEP